MQDSFHLAVPQAQALLAQTCVVCLEPVGANQVKPCQCRDAVFCLECYQEFRASGFSTCPICRAPIEENAAISRLDLSWLRWYMVSQLFSLILFFICVQNEVYFSLVLMSICMLTSLGKYLMRGKIEIRHGQYEYQQNRCQLPLYVFKWYFAFDFISVVSSVITGVTRDWSTAFLLWTVQYTCVMMIMWGACSHVQQPVYQ